MLELITEAYSTTQKVTGLNPCDPAQFIELLRDSKKFDTYKAGLCEGLEGATKYQFEQILESTRVKLMENSMFNFHPYEVLTAPILRNFYPKLIAKELVNIMPIDKPDVIKPFMRATFGTAADEGAYPYQFPYVNENRWADGEDAGRNAPILNQISRGPSVGVNLDAESSSNTIDLIALTGTSRGDATSIEKDFKITGSTDTSGNFQTLSVVPDVDGNIYFEVTYASGDLDRITGHIDYLNGYLYWNSVGEFTETIRFEGTVTLEENKINSKVNYTVDKIRFPIIMRQIQANWTLPMEQDLKALFDLNLQAELINIIGEQIAIEVDTEIIDDLIKGVYASDTTGRRTATFDKNPPSGFAWGRKNWYENVQIPLSDLSAEVYNANLMGAANIIACNPTDAALLESLNDFKFSGGSVDGGNVGYSSATVMGGKWKVLTSSIVPRGKMLLKYRAAEMQRASYVYAPYQPAVLSPFPMGNNPSMTIMTRYAKKMIRPESLALLNITDTGTYHVYGNSEA